jgi:hypothetical protein
MSNDKLRIINSENPPIAHFLIKDVYIDGCAALISSQGGGTPRAVTIKGKRIMMMGPMMTSGPGPKRFGTHLMMPPGSNPNLDKEQSRILRVMSGNKQVPTNLQQHGILQAIDSNPQITSEYKSYLETLELGERPKSPYEMMFKLSYPGSAQFPWSFDIEQRISFEEGKFIRRTKIINTSQTLMPVAIGWHDYLAVLANENQTVDEALRSIVITNNDTNEIIHDLSQYDDPEADQREVKPAPTSVTIYENGIPTILMSVRGDFLGRNVRGGTVNVWTDTMKQEYRNKMGMKVINSIEEKYGIQYDQWQLDYIGEYLKKVGYQCTEFTNAGFSPFAKLSDDLPFLKPGEEANFEIAIEVIDQQTSTLEN